MRGMMKIKQSLSPRPGPISSAGRLSRPRRNIAFTSEPFSMMPFRNLLHPRFDSHPCPRRFEIPYPHIRPAI